MKSWKLKSSTWATVFDWEEKKKEIEKLEQQSKEEGFWDKPQEAGEIMKKIESLKGELNKYQTVKKDFFETKSIWEEAREEDSDESAQIVDDSLDEIEKKVGELERKSFLSGKYDSNNAILAIHAGAGGDDAQDWAEMLMRMYLKYFEKQGYKAKIIQESRGSEAGIKSAAIEAKGEDVFGKLRTEKGVHRLVRLSPFNADNLRQTSFASVEVWPIIENDADIQLESKDLRVDTFRSSGAGGQSVNTTDSAVRVTHVPTGLVATCQSERSQLQNKDQAMKILKAKLADHLEEEQKKEERELKGEHKSAEWGNQIRSYVLHPYKLAKDHRTGHESAQVEDVLDGELGEFVEEALRFNF